MVIIDHRHQNRHLSHGILILCLAELKKGNDNGQICEKRQIF